MYITKSEMKRLVEFVNWGFSKGIKDSDFISLYNKLNDLCKTEAEEYFIKTINSDETSVSNIKNSYANLSEKAKAYINKRITEGYKNTYHSIMAVLDNKSKHNIKLVYDDIKQEYITKYQVLGEDMEAFEEIFDTCCAVYIRKNQVTILFTIEEQE